MNLPNVARWLLQHPESRLVAEPNILAQGQWYAACARRDDNAPDFDAEGATLDEALANLEASAAKIDWDESVAIAETHFLDDVPEEQWPRSRPRQSTDSELET